MDVELLDRWVDACADDHRMAGKPFQACYLLARALKREGRVLSVSELGRQPGFAHRRTVQRAADALMRLGYLVAMPTKEADNRLRTLLIPALQGKPLRLFPQRQIAYSSLPVGVRLAAE